jgi:hypothetical protein
MNSNGPTSSQTHNGRGYVSPLGGVSNDDTAAQKRTDAYKSYLETAPADEIQERIQESQSANKAIQGYPEGARLPLTEEQQRTQSALQAEEELTRGQAQRDLEIIAAVNRARRAAKQERGT